MAFIKKISSCIGLLFLPFLNLFSLVAIHPALAALLAIPLAADKTLSTINIYNYHKPPSVVPGPSLVFSEPAVPKPNYLSPIIDPTFKTQIIRITGDTGAKITFSGGGSGTWGIDARHHYMDDQPWNSDGTLLLLQNKDSPNQVILDGQTYQPKYSKCNTYRNWMDRWLPNRSHPYERMNVNGITLEWFDVITCRQTRHWTLPFAATADYEMGPSQDGRFVALGDATRVFVVDMDPQPPFASYASGNRRIGPPFDLRNCGLADCSRSTISISPLGKFVIMHYKGGDQNQVLKVDADTLSLSPHRMPTTAPQCSGHNPALGYLFDLGHPDMGLNPFDNNEEVIVGQRRSWCPRTLQGQALGSVVMVRLRDGQVTSLTQPSNEASAYHISLRNFDRPGWAYVSYWPNPGRRFNDEIVAVKLDGSQTVERLAHTHTDTTNCYRCEAHAVPSRDGRRVLFASDWSLNCGAACGTHGDVKAYIITSTKQP